MWPLLCFFLGCSAIDDVSVQGRANGGTGGQAAPAGGAGAAGVPGAGGSGAGATGGNLTAGVGGGASSAGAGITAGGGSGGAPAGTSGASGASGTAGSPQGGGAGASFGGAGGATAGCVTSGQELCDDFESGQIDPQKWKLNKPTGSASISVDGAHAHGGQYAVHIKIMAGQQSTAMITEAVTFPATSNSFYARAFMYFTPELPTAPGGDFHMGFILGIGKNDLGDVQAGTGMIGGAKQYLGYSIFFGPPKYEFGPWSKATVEPNKWQCIELFEDGSSPNEEKRQVWLDGVELTDLRSTSNGPGAPANHKPPAFNGATFGVWEYHPSPLLSDIWLDDIRVSATPIGCN
ncbi:MAG TPA: hypothetical protein VNG33_13845 [Polyangiaceae bacterium]|nr:hypothetical protein [Polyangiaceae bacterium]